MIFLFFKFNMEEIDQLFKKYIHELKVQDKLTLPIQNYKNYYTAFKKTLLNSDLKSASIVEVYKYYRKLKLTVYYLHPFFKWIKINILHGIKPTKSNLCKPKLYRDVRIHINGFKHAKTAPNIVSLRKGINILDRRFNLLLNQDNQVFFKGIADYIKYILEHEIISQLVKNNITDHSNGNGLLEEAWSNSVLSSWFNLELVYLIVHKKCVLINDEIISTLKHDLNLLITELEKILCIENSTQSKYFRKEQYITDIIRVHTCIIEILERELESQDNSQIDTTISYNYSSYGIPTGKLSIKGYDPINFLKLPATVLQFFYLHRSDKEFLSYQNFNEFSNSTMTSNQFRLIVTNINKRINESTSGIIKKIISKRTTYPQIVSTNQYKWNDKIQF